MNDFNMIFDNDYNYDLLHDFLWNRYDNDYSVADVEGFLEIIGSNCMVVGHNPEHDLLEVHPPGQAVAEPAFDQALFFGVVENLVQKRWTWLFWPCL